MIIIRKIINQLQKLFASRDVEPDLIKEGFIVSDKLLKIYGKARIFVEDKTKSYQKDIKSLASQEKTKIKKLITDIKSGYLFSDGPNKGDTHYLSGLSDPKKSLVYSKSINSNDRLVYRVYKPIPSQAILKSGETISILAQKVVLESCKGHKANGQGDYLKDPSLRNQANRKRNKKEDNNNK